MSYMRKNTFNLIRSWAKDKGIYANGDSKTQYLKLSEEMGELADALLKRNDEEVYDAIGDCVVVLTNIVKLYELEKARLSGETPKQGMMTIENCIDKAYNVIASRTGKMQNGTFVKDK